MINKLLIAGACAVSLSACQSTTSNYETVGYNSHMNEAVGTLTGAVAGGFIANRLSNDNSTATAVGALVGAGMGARAGRNQDEIDRIRMQSDNQYVEQAGWNAVYSGQPQQWRNPSTGSWGIVTPSAQYQYNYQGNILTCIDVHLKSVRNDLPHHGTGKMCQNPNGNWFFVK